MWEFIQIGKVLKAYRKSGQMLAVIDEQFFTDIKKMKAVFLKIDGLEVPFFIESLDLNTESSVLKLEEMKAPEDVKAYNGEGIFLRKMDVSGQKMEYSEDSPLMGLVGFKLFDKTTNKEFLIQKVEEYPQQLMAIIIVEGKEALIPLVADFIDAINEEEAIILMTLPEGMI